MFLTLFLMFLALLAYLSVLRVSMKSLSVGLMQAIMRVRLLPPRESWSSLVSLESLYGTWLPRLALSPRALMTLPRASCIETMGNCQRILARLHA